MTTDQPTPRVGDTITTAEQLDALPARTRIAIDGGDDVMTKGHDDAWRGGPYDNGDRVWVGEPEEAEGYLPVTLLYLPDAPHPAPVDGDAVERAARAIAGAADADYWFDEIAQWEGREQWERDAHPDECPSSAYEDRAAFRSQARAALAAARAGEAVDREALARLMRVTDSTDPEQQARFGRWWDERESVNPEVEAHAYARADAVLALLAARGGAAPTDDEPYHWCEYEHDECGGAS